MLTNSEGLRVTWINQGYDQILIKNFLRHQGVSRSFLTYFRRVEGRVLKNASPVCMNQSLHQGDEITLVIPPDAGNDQLMASCSPIEVIYEDRDILILNKPAGLVSVPSHRNREDALANRIKGYYLRTRHTQLNIHVVTRLDRGTSGLVLVAKHSLAHGILNEQVGAGEVQRMYQALLEGCLPQEHFMVEAPIGRQPESVLERRVTADGQFAKTEYWLEECYSDSCLCQVKLHTGRTHQIRVHSQWLGYPLVGDDLYGRGPQAPLMRQGLHCSFLAFDHPITKKSLKFKQALPDDFIAWCQARF